MIIIANLENDPGRALVALRSGGLRSIPPEVAMGIAANAIRRGSLGIAREALTLIAAGRGDKAGAASVALDLAAAVDQTRNRGARAPEPDLAYGDLTSLTSVMTQRTEQPTVAASAGPRSTATVWEGGHRPTSAVLDRVTAQAVH